MNQFGIVPNYKITNNELEVEKEAEGEKNMCPKPRCCTREFAHIISTHQSYNQVNT
jgi:hypothetical protein